MKCPHCDYRECITDESNIYPAKEGDFYYLPIEMERGLGYDRERCKVVGCPKCHKIFMSDW